MKLKAINTCKCLAPKCVCECNKPLKILSQQTKIRLYHTIICPVLLYGAQTYNEKKLRKKTYLIQK